MKPLAVVLTLISASIACSQTIICPADAPANAKLAAKEIRRYVYLRTGKLLPIGPRGQGIALKIDPMLAAQQYRLKTDRGSLTISGGSDVAVLYGAYALAEKLGVRFYLDGDVIPDTKIPFAIPSLDEMRLPLFELRGIQPFHDFPEGPDWWNQDDYLAYLTQLAKMRMNFLGLHCYPEGGVGPEPLVWIGLSNDLDADGRVKFSYPSYWANTATRHLGLRADENQRVRRRRSACCFPADDYGPDVMAGLMPRPDTPEQCNDCSTAPAADEGRLRQRPAARRQDLHRHRNPADDSQGSERTSQGAGKDPADTNTVRALYTRHVQAHRRRSARWTTTGSGRRKAGLGAATTPGQFEATTSATSRPRSSALDDLATRSRSPPAAGCSARRTTAPRWMNSSRSRPR